MKINGIGISRLGYSNKTNNAQEQNLNYIKATTQYSTDSFANNKVSFKGNWDNIPPYTIETFNNSYPEAVRNLKHLGDAPGTLAKRSLTLSVHYDGVKRLIEQGHKDEELYNAFMDLALNLIKVKEERNSPLAAAQLLKQTQEFLEKYPFESSGLNQINKERLMTGSLETIAKTIKFAANSEFSPNIKIDKSIEEFFKTVDYEYYTNGEAHFDRIVDAKDMNVISDSSKALVKGGYFDVIKDFFEMLGPKDINKRNNLITLDLADELSKLSKTNPKVTGFVDSLLQNKYIAENVKNIIKRVF